MTGFYAVNNYLLYRRFPLFRTALVLLLLPLLILWDFFKEKLINKSEDKTNENIKTS